MFFRPKNACLLKPHVKAYLGVLNLHSIKLQFTAVAVLGLGKQLIIAGHITVIILFVFVNTIALVKSKAIEIFIIVVHYLKTR